MKKAFIVLMFLPVFSLGQTAYDYDNQWQSNYWKTRINFTNYFCVVGNEHGNSIPFNRNPIPWRPCENPEYAAGKKTYVGSLLAGDATIRLGQYIASLALEYQMLKDNNKDTKRTLTELYFAIRAVERLDNYAEFFNSGKLEEWDPANNNSLINGYLVRDDFESDLWDNYDGQPQNYFREEIKRGDRYDEDVLQQKKYVATDNNMACGIGSQSNIANVFNSNNQISKDQLAGLLLGFAILKKMNLDLVFSPTSNYPSINFLSKSVEITRKIMDHWTAVKL